MDSQAIEILQDSVNTLKLLVGLFVLLSACALIGVLLIFRSLVKHLKDTHIRFDSEYPTLEDDFQKKARSLMDRNKLDELIELAQDRYQRFPANPQVLNTLINVYHRKNDSQSVDRYARELYSVAPDKNWRDFAQGFMTKPEAQEEEAIKDQT